MRIGLTMAYVDSDGDEFFDSFETLDETEVEDFSPLHHPKQYIYQDVPENYVYPNYTFQECYKFTSRPTQHCPSSETAFEVPPVYDYTPFNNKCHFQQHSSEQNDKFYQSSLIENSLPKINITNKSNHIQTKTPEYPQNHQDMSREFLSAVQMIAQNFHKKEIIYPTFTGNESEDPTVFLKNLEELFRQERVNIKERTNIAASLLKGPAQQWYQPYKHIALSWEMFKSQFMDAFSNTAVIAHLTTQLYGEKQKTNESAIVFITKKQGLFYRLIPQASEIHLINIIMEQLVPDIRSRLRGLQFNTIQKLLQVVTAIEKDLTYTHLNQQYTTKESSIEDLNRATQNKLRQENRPHSACKYCGAWHFHKDCSRNPYNQRSQEQTVTSNRRDHVNGHQPNQQEHSSANHTLQENWRGEGQKPVAGRP